MGITELRESIHAYIDHADKDFLSEVYALVNQYVKNEGRTIAYRAGKALTKEQLRQELIEAEAEIERGDFLTIEEFEKASKQWA